MTVTSKKHYTGKDIAGELESYIVDNRLPGGSRLPNTAQLAERFNVSEKTIHRTMDNLVKKRMLYRVRGSGTFVSEHARPQLRRTIGFFQIRGIRSFLPNLDYLAFDLFREELCARFDAEENCSVNLILQPLNEVHDRHFDSLARFDCIIAAGGYVKRSPKLFNCGKKVILIQDNQFHHGPFHQVLVDYLPGFRKALQHLKSQGARKLFVAAVAIETDNLRHQALLQAASLEGFAPDSIAFYASAKPYLPDIVSAGRDCAEKFLAEYADRAIVSLSDYVSLGMVVALEERGITPGLDVPMVSYDNLLRRLPEFADKVRFGSIAHPLEKMLDAVMVLYRQIIKNDNQGFCHAISVPAEDFYTNVK